jgi:LPS-assembly lipoprotein
MRAGLALLLAALMAASLSSCGFQLRGTADLPFKTVYLPPSNTPGVALELRRNIQAGTRATVVDEPKNAEAVIEFTHESRDKVILSLTGGGRVREFELQYRVSFRVHDNKGGEFLAPNTILLKRAMTYSDSEILAKEREEQSIYRSLESEMVQQIMYRLEAAQRPRS